MQPRHALIGSPVTLVAAAMVFAAAGGLAGWFWSGQSVPDVTIGEASAPLIAAVALAPPPLPPADLATAVEPGPMADDAPSNILLVGTITETRREAATFLVDGRIHTVPLGARLGGSVLVLTQVTSQSVQLGLPGGASAVEIKLRPAREIAQRLSLERQADGVAADLGVRNDRAAQTVPRRGAGPGATEPTADMMLTAPPRERQKPGPVGAF